MAIVTETESKIDIAVCFYLLKCQLEICVCLSADLMYATLRFCFEVVSTLRNVLCLKLLCFYLFHAGN